MRSIKTFRTLVFVSLALTSLQTLAQAFPSRAVRIIVPASPSASESLARVISAKLSERLGQPVVVENRPGAGGQIAISALIQAAPDGHTYLVTPNVMTIAPAVRKDLPYDPVRDLAAVARLATATFVLVVNSELPAKSLSELISLAKIQPGKLNFGSPGIGTPQHMMMEYIRQARNLDIVYIPAPSTTAVTETAAGRIHGGVYVLTQVLPFVQSGKLRVLATIGSTRSPAIPDVPSIREAGIDALESPWVGMFAPAGTAPQIVSRVSAEVNAILGTAEARELLAKQGITVSTSTPSELAGEVVREIEVWKKVAAQAGIQPQ